jgi:hypothetical protein
MSLQEEVEQFVAKWGPESYKETMREIFIMNLRRLLNHYAEAALQHGALPEKDTPHDLERAGRYRKGRR